MYKISKFAQLTGVTAKTLRFYEAQGLLLPAQIDSATGYRYYESEQIKILSKILQLKQLGFSLHEIKAFINGKISPADKIAELERRKIHLEETIKLLRFQGDAQFGYNAYFKSEPQLHLLQKQVRVADFHQLLGEYQRFYEESIKTRICLAFPEYCMIEYLDNCYKEQDLSARLCLGVTPGSANNITHRPATTYVATIHRGDYDTLYAAYDFLYHYVDLQSLTVCGSPSELFYESYGSCNDENDYITEVRLPIANKID